MLELVLEALKIRPIFVAYLPPFVGCLYDLQIRPLTRGL